MVLPVIFYSLKIALMLQNKNSNVLKVTLPTTQRRRGAERCQKTGLPVPHSARDVTPPLFWRCVIRCVCAQRYCARFDVCVLGRLRTLGWGFFFLFGKGATRNSSI